MFAIFITHTSFQLWHCVFPVSYLRTVRYPTETAGTAASGTTGTEVSGTPPSSGVVLRCSRAYDFANVAERGAWLDVLVGLVLYLRSGESRVGYLSKALGRNRLHKRVEEAEAQAEAEAQGMNVQVQTDEDSEMEMETAEEAPEVAPRSPSRKRRFENTTATTATAADEAHAQTPPKSQRRWRV